jgi:hypothetical protein
MRLIELNPSRLWRGTLVVLMLAGMLSALPSASWADTLTLKTGESVQGRLRELVGELIFVKNYFGRQYKLNRSDLASRHDVVTMKSGEVIEGFILYATPYRWEIQTSKGALKVWRFRVRDARLGV